MSKPILILSWTLRLLVAGILLQTLYFKFTAAPESVYIFSSLGLEPWGRWAAGLSELVASILLLWPGMTFIGAGLGLGVISGALMAHLTKLGIVVLNDGGLLFGLACAVFAGCLILLGLHRSELRSWMGRLSMIGGRR
jgi:hypothetical protein